MNQYFNVTVRLRFAKGDLATGTGTTIRSTNVAARDQIAAESVVIDHAIFQYPGATVESVMSEGVTPNWLEIPKTIEPDKPLESTGGRDIDF